MLAWNQVTYSRHGSVYHLLHRHNLKLSRNGAETSYLWTLTLLSMLHAMNWLTVSNWSKHSEAFKTIFFSIGHLHNGNTQTVWEEPNRVDIFTHQTCLYRFFLYLHCDCFLVKGIVIVCWLQRNRHKKSTFRLLWKLLPWSFLWLFKFLWNFVSMSQHIGIGWRLIHRNFIYSLWIWETRWVAVKIVFILILKICEGQISWDCMCNF